MIENVSHEYSNELEYSIKLLMKYKLDYTVFQRSCDAVYGFNNDNLWHRYVMNKLVYELKRYDRDVILGDMMYNCGSLHVYSRHFKFLE